jgi:hypothetical protein
MELYLLHAMAWYLIMPVTLFSMDRERSYIAHASHRNKTYLQNFVLELAAVRVGVSVAVCVHLWAQCV